MLARDVAEACLHVADLQQQLSFGLLRTSIRCEGVTYCNGCTYMKHRRIGSACPHVPEGSCRIRAECLNQSGWSQQKFSILISSDNSGRCARPGPTSTSTFPSFHPLPARNASMLRVLAEPVRYCLRRGRLAHESPHATCPALRMTSRLHFGNRVSDPTHLPKKGWMVWFCMYRRLGRR